jgi:hypothetical protein
LLVKIFGVIILVSAVIGLPLSTDGFVVRLSIWNSAHVHYTWRDVAFVGAGHFGPFVVYMAVGLCFLWWSGRIIDRVGFAPERGETEALAESSDLRNMEISLVAVVGLYFLADGLAELCRVSLGEAIRYPLVGSPSLFWNVEIGFIVEALVKIIVGILLVLGRGGTVAVLRSARVWVRKMRTWPD